MILELLQPDIITFVTQHEQSDVNELLLKYKKIHGVPASLIADQIKGRQKAKYKLPLLYRSKQIIYPPSINLEQSSSEVTANFKLDFVRKVFDNELLTQGADLSGGFGIDALFLSRFFQEYHFVEPNTELITIARHNHQSLEAKNIAYENIAADMFLSSFKGKLDFVYVDPSRRLKDNRKVFSFSDCEPDIPSLQKAIFEKTDHILIKASPLLDISVGVKEIAFVKKVMIVAVGNECKELLFYCKKGFAESPVIEALTIDDEKEKRSLVFTIEEEQMANVKISLPKQYLYEPDASILKAGAFRLIASRYQIDKLHPNTHLYTSERLVLNFPGKIFKIISCIKPDAGEVAKIFPDGKANITTRNYPLTVDQLKKKTGLKDGGDRFLIGCTATSQKLLVAADRIK